MTNRKWREVATEKMTNPKAAAAYLKVALEEYERDGDVAVLLIAIRTVVDAKGGIGALAKATGLNRQTLYRTLDGKHSPRLDTLSAILNFCGLSLSLKPASKASEVRTGI